MQKKVGIGSHLGIVLLSCKDVGASSIADVAKLVGQSHELTPLQGILQRNPRGSSAHGFLNIVRKTSAFAAADMTKQGL